MADGVTGEVVEAIEKTLLAALEREIRRGDRRRLFGDVSLSRLERRQISVFVSGTGVVRTGRLTTLWRRLDRTLPFFITLAQRGIDPLPILSAVDLPRDEAEALAVEYFARVRIDLGKQSAAVQAVMRRLDRLLLRHAEARGAIHFHVQRAVEPMRFAHMVLAKVLRAKAHLQYQTQNPLVQRPPIRLARVLVRGGIARAEAYRLTAAFLRAWEPKRFADWLTAKVVRRRCERARARRTV